MNKKQFIVEEFEDSNTGMRIFLDSNGNYHCFMPGSGGVGDIHVHIPEIKIPDIPPAQVSVEITPPVDDPEKKRLLRIIEALRSENNWLWGVIMTAIIDRKKKGAATAMDELEQKIKERQRA